MPVAGCWAQPSVQIYDGIYGRVTADLFFQINDLSFLGLLNLLLASESFIPVKQDFLEKHWVIGEVVGHGWHALDYTRQATNLGVKPDVDGCAKDQNRRSTNSILGRSARWPRRWRRAMF